MCVYESVCAIFYACPWTIFIAKEEFRFSAEYENRRKSFTTRLKAALKSMAAWGVDWKIEQPVGKGRMGRGKVLAATSLLDQ